MFKVRVGLTAKILFFFVYSHTYVHVILKLVFIPTFIDFFSYYLKVSKAEEFFFL